MADANNDAESDVARALGETGNSTGAQSSVSDQGATGDQTTASAQGPTGDQNTVSTQRPVSDQSPTGDQTTRIARRIALVAAVSAAVASLVFFIGTPMPMGNYESGVGGVPVRPYLAPELSVCVFGFGLLSALVFCVAFPIHLAGPSSRGRAVSGVVGAIGGGIVVFFVGFACAWNYPSLGGAHVPEEGSSRIELNYGFTQAHTIGFERRYLLFMMPTDVVRSDYLGR